MKKTILVKFGEKVRQQRIKKGLSQEELAEKAGVHRTYIGMVERAEKNITLSNIEKIALALNTSVSSLFSDTLLGWDEEIKKICNKYNIFLENLPLIIQDPKVLPMIRGKSFEFSALSKFIAILDLSQWYVSKLVLNPQFGIADEDITLTHIKTEKKITLECKLAAKGRYRLLKNNQFQIDVKCMRSRTLGEERIKHLAPLIGVTEDVLKIHNDQYRIIDFDLVVTSIANAFYETDNQTGFYEWKPKEIAISFLKTICKDSSLDLNNSDIQKNFAFEQVYVACSSQLTATLGNSVKCSRKKCNDRYNCGFIPNYPQITFDLSTGKPLEPWLELKDCLLLLENFIA